MLAISALAVALGFGALAAAPAQAQSTTSLTAAVGHTAAAASSTVTSNATPAIVCDYIDSRGVAIPLCSTGNFYDGGAPYRWPVTYVWNYAAERVWFHQYEDGSGWAKCFSGGYIGSVPAAYQDPGNIFISDNTAAC